MSSGPFNLPIDNSRASLAEVVTTDQLLRRPCKTPSFITENRAMLELAQYLSESPADILQKLAEVAMTLCHAGSSGVSIIEEENEVFRWYGLAGELAEHRWGTTPRFFSPCGTVVDSASVQLMSNPEKHFEYLAEVKPAIAEALLVPFSVNAKIVGTVWVIMHKPSHHFDNEDVRIITNLSVFAAAGFKIQLAQKNLETAIHNRDEFLAVLGHELRNPLSPMTTAHSLLSTSRLDKEIQQPAVNMIGRQLTHMQRLVDDILDASRIAEGKIAVNKQTVEIGGLVSEAVESMRSKAMQSNLRLSITLPPQPIYLNADPGRIIQIINNLLHNAIKFTPANGDLAVDVNLDDKCVRISVRDNGIGLAPENLDSIFSMFSQVESFSANNKGGLGIGLGLAKTLTELHDGKITVRSAGLNKGCEFSIVLPVLAEFSAVACIEASETPKAPHSQPLRILIADDNKDAADSLSSLLRLIGHDVHIAYNGLNAVTQALTWQPHVILLDLSLPGLNGYEVIEQLRLNSPTRHCVIAALTGYASVSDRVRTKESGFDAHLAKPLDIGMLRKLLDAVVIYDGSERRLSKQDFSGTERRRLKLNH